MKTILITGAGNGIGRGLLFHFHGLGWKVIGLDTDKQALAEIAGTLPSDSCFTQTCNVGREKEVLAAFEKISEWLGECPLDALINNAAIADPYCGPMEDLALDDWNRWIDASLNATFLCSRAAIPLLRRASGDPADDGRQAASIINISSSRALQSEPETFAYAASKGGVSALTHAMAVSLGPEVRVNAILPGWIETGPWQKKDERRESNHRDVDREQHPAGRVGRVEDITGAAEWLVSEAAGFVTGQQIVVDGGMTVKMIYAH